MFIFGTKISEKKRVDIALLECFGLNHSSSNRVMAKLGLNVDKKLALPFKYDFEFQIPELVKRGIQRFVGFTLKNYLFLRMRRIKRVKTLRSFRHSLFLPVRGQRTRKNAQTQKLRRKDRKKLPIPKKKK